MGFFGPECQSCGMPLKRDEKGGGTNADGSVSTEYCSRCWQDGKFTRPKLNAEQMKQIVREKMVEMGVPKFVARILSRNVAQLRRWMTADSIKAAVLIFLINSMLSISPRLLWAEDPTSACQLYLLFWDMGTEMKGDHLLKVGEKIYRLNLSKPTQAFLIETTCDTNDMYLDGRSLVPVIFTSGKAYFRLSPTKMRMKDLGKVVPGFRVIDALKLYKKGYFVGATIVREEGPPEI